MEGEIEPVFCELKYSGVVASLLALAAVATLAIVAVLPWTLSLRASVALAVAALALRSHRAIFEVRMLRVAGAGEVEVSLGDGRRCNGRLEPASFVAPWLTLVRWRPAGARYDRTVLVAPGMAHPEAFRRLRVRLRHG
jgi:hypothetical protein